MDPRDFGVIPAMSGVVSMVQNSQKQLRVVCKQVDIVPNSQNHPKSHVLDVTVSNKDIKGRRHAKGYIVFRSPFASKPSITLGIAN